MVILKVDSMRGRMAEAKQATPKPRGSGPHSGGS